MKSQTRLRLIILLALLSTQIKCARDSVSINATTAPDSGKETVTSEDGSSKPETTRPEADVTSESDRVEHSQDGLEHSTVSQIGDTEDVTDFQAAGPYAVTSYSDPGLSGYSIYMPTKLGEGGRKHFVISWGNGTNAPTIAYLGILKHLASHGFIVVASKSGHTGSGQEILDGARYILAADADRNSRFFGKVDTRGAGATGHSQGAKGALNAGNHSPILTTAPIQPTDINGVARLNLLGPAFLIAGSDDSTVPPSVVQNQFSSAGVAGVFGILNGADHYAPIGGAGDIIGYLAAWFAWQLRNDQNAATYFSGPNCKICVDAKWQVAVKQP